MRKQFQEFLNRVFGNLKMTDKAKQGNLTEEDWVKINENFKEVHGEMDFYQMLAKVQEEEANSEDMQQRAAQHDAALAIINTATSTASDDGGDGGDGGAQNTDLGTAVQGLVGRVASLEGENQTMRAALGQLPNDTAEQHTVNIMVLGNPPAHSDTQLFGNSHAMFARASRWNQLFDNPGAIYNMADASKPEQDQFNDTFSAYAGQVAAGIRGLQAAGQLNPEVLRSSSNPDLTALTNAGLGDQYMQFRTREIIARVLEIDSPFGIFPMQSNVSDRIMLTNAFVEDLSQAYQDSESALKGGGSLEPEWSYVDDAMILTSFGDFKVMERRYINYLNKNGSDPVKWTMIEYFLLLYMKKAVNEQYERVISGIYLKPTAGVSGHYLNASTGIINRVKFYHIEKKVRAFEDITMATYDDVGTNFIDVIIELHAELKIQLGRYGIKVDKNLAIFANENHEDWFKKGYRAKYKQDGDFSKIDSSVVPDTKMRIIWVPNMNDTRMIMVSEPGNLQCMQNVPGEMLAFYLERRLSKVYAQSTWKEGSGSEYAGRLATTYAALNARKWNQQAIWFPKPFIELDADATTADADIYDWFKTVENTGATTITDIDNKEVGKLFIVECGHLTNATTIEKSGLFSEITATFTPVVVGDLIAFVWDAGSSKFQEICRRVNDVVSYNADTTPFAGAR